MPEKSWWWQNVKLMLAGPVEIYLYPWDKHRWWKKKQFFCSRVSSSKKEQWYNCDGMSSRLLDSPQDVTAQLKSFQELSSKAAAAMRLLKRLSRNVVCTFVYLRVSIYKYQKTVIIPGWVENSLHHCKFGTIQQIPMEFLHFCEHHHENVTSFVMNTKN